MRFKKASGSEFEIWHVTDKGKAKFGKEDQCSLDERPTKRHFILSEEVDPLQAKSNSGEA